MRNSAFTQTRMIKHARPLHNLLYTASFIRDSKGKQSADLQKLSRNSLSPISILQTVAIQNFSHITAPAVINEPSVAGRLRETQLIVLCQKRLFLSLGLGRESSRRQGRRASLRVYTRAEGWVKTCTSVMSRRRERSSNAAGYLSRWGGKEREWARLTFRKSRNHMTSGFGSPTTSHWIITVSPSWASVDKGFVTNSGTLE